jgi:hypothetical protein
LADLQKLFADQYTTDELNQRLNKHQRKMIDGQSDLILVQEKVYRHNEKLDAITKRLEALQGTFFLVKFIHFYILPGFLYIS